MEQDPTVYNYLLQGGSFGLIALITIFLMRYIPKRMEAMDKQAEIDAQSREAITARHAAIVDGMIKAFQNEQKYEREQCNKQFTELLEEQKEQTRILDNMAKALADNRQPPHPPRDPRTRRE